jgi:hypothetical protein
MKQTTLWMLMFVPAGLGWMGLFSMNKLTIGSVARVVRFAKNNSDQPVAILKVDPTAPASGDWSHDPSPLETQADLEAGRADRNVAWQHYGPVPAAVGAVLGI